MSEDRIKRAERRRISRLKDNRRKNICNNEGFIYSMYYYEEDGYVKYCSRSQLKRWLKRNNNRRLRRSTKDLYRRSVYKKANEYWWLLT